MTEMTESHRTEPHTIHTKGRNRRERYCFSSFPEAPLRRLRRLLRRQAVIAALGPVCRAASNFDNGIAPGAAHGCAPRRAAHIPCRAVPDLPHRQRLSDRGNRRGEEDENAAERRRDTRTFSDGHHSVPAFTQSRWAGSDSHSFDRI